MVGYTKLFSSIVSSTIWREDLPTKVVWITLLAMSDKEGMVEGSIPGLAHIAGVTVEECERALANLQQPDKYSRTPDHEGRRIEVVDGGWLILNRAKYRDLIPEEHRRERDRIRQERRRRKQRADDVKPSGVTECDSHELSPQKEEKKEDLKAISSKPDGSDRWMGNAIQDLFAYYLLAAQKNPKLYVFSRPRKSKGLARLEYCYKLAGEPKQEKAVALFKVAIDRFSSSAFHNGQNQQGKKYLDWELLCRSDEKFSYWLDDQNFVHVGANKPNGHAGRQVPA